MSQVAEKKNCFKSLVILLCTTDCLLVSSWTKLLLRIAAEVKPNVSPPSTYEISEVDLKNEHKKMK